MNKKNFYLLLSLISLMIVLIFTRINLSLAQTSPNNQASVFPVPQVHSLPPSLRNYQNTSENYFSEIKKLPIGYLIWSDFPIKVYIEQPEKTLNNYTEKIFQEWINRVKIALSEWINYLPLTIINDADNADIKIMRSRPDIRAKFNNKTRQFDIGRARSGETKYELYIKKTSENQSILAHKCTVKISPDQGDNAIQASARHEIGHALGIWGHSPLQTDVMYFSQVRNPPLISARDINTLKLIYQQPTSLGWKL
jgi:predicted Zn-dependent protease